MKLYRVDIALKYLYLGDEEPTDESLLKWMRECHSGELDNDVAINEVTAKEQIDDFNYSYCPYRDDDEEDECLEDLIPKLGLDIPFMIKTLKKAGYKVTKS